MHLKVLVASHASAYQAAYLAMDKMDIVYKVFSDIKARRGRFLKQESDGWWYESPDVEALDKVTMVFQRMIRNESHHGNDSPRSAPDNGDDDVSMFIQQGKRPRFDPSCCGK